MNQTQTTAVRDPEKEVLQYQNDRMRQLGRRDGFFKAYFDVLQNEPSNIQAFEKVNAEYMEYFGEEKYASYKAFEVVRNRFLKTQQ